MLAPVPCDHISPFNYDGKKASNAGLTSRYHLRNMTPDSIFRDSIGHGLA